jgi:hypothetical protein
MLSRPGELVARGLRDVADALVGQAQREDLESLPEFLPEACTLGGLECRLDENPQVDFGLCLEREKSFAGMGHPWECDKAPPCNLGKFIDEWTTHDSLLRDNVACIWLGFDRTGSSESDMPFVYFAPSSGNVSFRPRDDELIEQVVRQGLALLAPGVHDQNLPMIRRCLGTLTDRAELLLVASLHQRGVAGVRLELRMQTDQLVDFLQRYGWPGDYDWLSGMLTALDTHHWHMPIQIEVTDRILPTLSLEFPVTPDDIPRRDWEFVLEQFERLGYCLPEKRAAVTEWLNGRSGANDRQLDLKVRHDGRGNVVAKAYLVFQDTLSLF